MDGIATYVKRYPLTTYFVLAYALSWGLVLLTPVSLVFACGALFGPAAAAVIVTGIEEGRTGVRTLLRRAVQWRVGWPWYTVALGLPFLLGLAAVGLHLLLGASYAFQPGGPLLLSLLLGVLVIGEELGWRGYALPRLQARYGGLGASLLLGGLWATWHLSNATIPGLERYWYAFGAFALFVLPQTVLFTWISNHKRSSVLPAWLFHQAINTAGSVLFVGDQVRQWWLSATVFGLAAAIVAVVTGPQLSRKPAPQSGASGVGQTSASARGKA